MIFTDDIILVLDKIVTTYGWRLNLSSDRKIVWADKTIRDITTNRWLSISIDFHAIEEGYKTGFNWDSAKSVDRETAKKFTDAHLEFEKILERSKAILK